MTYPGNMQIDYSPISDLASTHSPYTSNTLAGQEHFANQFSDFQNTGSDFNLFGDNEDLYNANVQLPTPSHDIFQRGFETSGVGYASEAAPHFSPVGHGNTMLYTPTSLLEDEGFEDLLPSNCQMGTADFQLFPSSASGTVASSAPSALFGEIPSTANINYPGVSAQELLDFYAASTAAATAGHTTGAMDWSSEDQFTHYERQ
jgi:hypothetical protein